MKTLNKNVADIILDDQCVRTQVTGKSLLWFIDVYLNQYIQYEFASFHKEIIMLCEDENIKNLGVVAFRGSGKSTLMNLAYPIWSIIGKQQKKFIVIASKTQQQARQQLKNIKDELESNGLLKTDLGPFEEQDDEWRSYSLVLPKYGARITAVSVEQSLRGIRHGAHRPDLIICDDIEDLASVQTAESRDKTDQWLTSELIPAGDKNTRFMIMGNLLHDDSVIMRVKKKIEDGNIDGEFRQYPLIDDKDTCIWKGKYHDQKAIDDERKRIGKESAWQREMMLNIVTDNDRVIHPDWIHHYDQLPKKGYRSTAIGIDLAISKSTNADYTAMVCAHIFQVGKERIIYILPNPVNERLNYGEAIDRAVTLAKSVALKGNATLHPEKVAYQAAFGEELRRRGLRVNEFRVGGQDKRTKLNLTTNLLMNQQVRFPEKGCERLIQQLIGFGSEKYDDLADAFAILINKINSKRSNGISLAVGNFNHMEMVNLDDEPEKLTLEERVSIKRCGFKSITDRNTQMQKLFDEDFIFV